MERTTQLDFDSDLKIGEITEYFVFNYFVKKGFVPYKYEGNYKYSDLKISSKDGKHLFDVEVKTDLKYEKTKNIFIETKSRGNDSGITTTNSKYWFHSTGTFILVFNTEKLKKFVSKVGANGETKMTNTWGCVIPFDELFNNDEIDFFYEYRIISIPKDSDAHSDNLKKYLK